MFRPTMNPGSRLKQQVVVGLALLATAWLAPPAAHAQSANPTFRSAAAATLGGVVNFRAASSCGLLSRAVMAARGSGAAVWAMRAKKSRVVPLKVTGKRWAWIRTRALARL